MPFFHILLKSQKSVCVCVPAQICMNSQSFSSHWKFSMKFCFLQLDEIILEREKYRFFNFSEG